MCVIKHGDGRMNDVTDENIAINNMCDNNLLIEGKAVDVVDNDCVHRVNDERDSMHEPFVNIYNVHKDARTVDSQANSHVA